LEVDASLSKFATVLDHVSGFYVNDDFGRQVQRLSELLPLLLDFLAQAPAQLRADLDNFLSAFTAHRKLSSSRAFASVIRPEFRAPVAHWLLRCHSAQRRSFHVVFAYIAAANGMPCLNPAAFEAEPYASPLRGHSPVSAVRASHLLHRGSFAAEVGPDGPAGPAILCNAQATGSDKSSKHSLGDDETDVKVVQEVTEEVTNVGWVASEGEHTSDSTDSVVHEKDADTKV